MVKGWKLTHSCKLLIRDQAKNPGPPKKSSKSDELKLNFYTRWKNAIKSEISLVSYGIHVTEATYVLASILQLTFAQDYFNIVMPFLWIILTCCALHGKVTILSTLLSVGLFVQIPPKIFQSCNSYPTFLSDWYNQLWKKYATFNIDYYPVILVSYFTSASRKSMSFASVNAIRYNFSYFWLRLMMDLMIWY